jgi:hypothetical protein
MYQMNHRVVSNSAPLDQRYTNFALELRKLGSGLITQGVPGVPQALSVDFGAAGTPTPVAPLRTPSREPPGPSPCRLKSTKTLLAPSDFGLRDLWLSGIYHPRLGYDPVVAGYTDITADPNGIDSAARDGDHTMHAYGRLQPWAVHGVIRAPLSVFCMEND